MPRVVATSKMDSNTSRIVKAARKCRQEIENPMRHFRQGVVQSANPMSVTSMATEIESDRYNVVSISTSTCTSSFTNRMATSSQLELE